MKPVGVDTVPTGTHDGRIWKVSRTYFANYPGDVLVTEESGAVQKQVILHWDGQNFLTIPLVNPGVIRGYEQATFAPTSFPSH